MDKPIRETISLRELEDKLHFKEFIKDFIKYFSCRDKDVESFLKEKAFDFEKRNKSRTYLIFENFQLMAYFSLSLDAIVFDESISKTTIKKIDGFSNKVKAVGLVLIGQLGKNEAIDNKITGKEILDICLHYISIVKDTVGSRYVMLECQDIPKIIDFYKANGFEFLKSDNTDKYQQMIRKL